MITENLNVLRILNEKGNVITSYLHHLPFGKKRKKKDKSAQLTHL